MNIDTIRILGIDYGIEFVAPNIGESVSLPAGECLTTKTTIRINTEANSGQHMKAVLLHEIIEALNYRLELQLEHPQITQLESALFAVLNDNPNLVKYLFKRDPTVDPSFMRKFSV